MATILLTGSTGTVGQALVPALKQRHHQLIHLTRGPNAESRICSALGKPLYTE